MASPHGASPVSASADFTCAGVHVGMALEQQRRRPGDMRRGHARSAEGRPRALRRGTDERTPRPAPLTSGLKRNEIGVGPLDGEARDRRGARALVATAATVIALAAMPGEPTEPRPKSSKSLPAAIDGDDAGVGRRVDRLHDEVPGRLDLRLAEREVDHVHPVRDGRLDRRRRSRASSRPGRRRRRSGSSAPCSCRGTRGGRLQRGAAARERSFRCRPRCPATWVPCDGVTRVERLRGVRPAGARRRERSRDDHLRRREGRLPLREARRHG